MLAELDRLVQLIESPIFTCKYIQNIGPLEYEQFCLQLHCSHLTIARSLRLTECADKKVRFLCPGLLSSSYFVCDNYSTKMLDKQLINVV